MNWNRFLLLWLPSALLVLGLGAELLARVLNPVPLRRQDVDLLVVAIDRLKSEATIVLAGDSVTQDVAKTYRLGRSGSVANLTTNQASGVIGLRLLLDRYLARHEAPAHLVIAATPEFLSYEPEGRAAKIYVSSVFRRPEEQALLARFIPPKGWRPAALAVEDRLWEPLVSLAAPTPGTWPGGEIEPDQTVLESAPAPAGVASQIAGRAAKPLGLSPSAQDSLRAICSQALRHGFTLHLVWAPMPESVVALRRKKRDFDALEAALAQVLADCPQVERADINALASFPDHAFRDSDHLRRPGWTARYAFLLKNYLARFAPTG